VRRFNTTTATFSLRFRNLNQVGNFHEILSEIFDSIIDRVMTDSNDYDLVGAEFIHPSLSTPVLLSFRRRDEFHGSQILHVLERIMQSNTQLTLDDDKIKIKFVKVTPPQGEGHHKRQCTNLDKQLKPKRSIIRINNKDKLCLVRALVVAKA